MLIKTVGAFIRAGTFNRMNTVHANHQIHHISDYRAKLHLTQLRKQNFVISCAHKN